MNKATTVIRFIKIGYGNLVQENRIVVMLGPDAAPIKRMVQEAKELGALIDATAGHKTQTVLIMDTDHIVLSAWTIDKIHQELDRATEEEKTPTAE